MDKMNEIVLVYHFSESIHLTGAHKLLQEMHTKALAG